MKASEIKQKNTGELEKTLGELRERVRKERFNIVTKQVKNVRELRTTKRTIALILTELRHRQSRN